MAAVVGDLQTSRGVTFRKPTADEKAEQAQICTLIGALGGVFYVLGTRRAQYCGLCGGRNQDQGTRQTPGIADLFALLPPPPTTYPQPGTAWVPLWIEVKGRGGSLSLEQLAFRGHCAHAGLVHLVGGVDEVIAYLEARGWLVPKGAR